MAASLPTTDRPLRRVSSAWLAVIGVALAGCTTDVEPATDEDAGSTHALISIERTVPAEDSEDSPQVARAEALAGFVAIPAEVDANRALRAVGLALDLPNATQCSTGVSEESAEALLDGTGRLELLAVGDVSLEAAETTTSLAPRAIPTIADLVSGVVYTTRDVSADPLPAAVSYTVRTGGSGAIAAMDLDGDAPAEIGGITVGGIPLAEVDEIRSSRPVDLTWNVGEAADLVVIELATDSAPTTVCAFRDDLGAASIPAGTFNAAGRGRLSVHRVRTLEFTSEDIERGELRFDFAVATDVTFAP